MSRANEAPRAREARATAPFELAGVRWWPRPGLATGAVWPVIERAWAALEAGAEDRKRGRRKGLHALDLAGEGVPDHLLKVNRYGRGRRRRSKSRHELALAAALAARGLPAPVPLAAGERREGGHLVACYLLVEILPGVVDLREELALRPPSPARRRALAEALGTLARSLHDAGFHQDDFQPNNFLVRWPTPAGAPPELFVVDFERARLRRRAVPDRLRHRALAKLDREIGRGPSSLRMRFLRAYAAGDDGGARTRWHAIAAEAPALVRRDVGHLLRNATVPGRRFEELRLARWRGLALPGCDTARIERAVAHADRNLGPVALAPDASEWGLRLERGGLRHARRTLACALVLAARGLAPRPIALLWDRTSSILVLERGPCALPAHELRRNTALGAAWRVLERRLDAYGRRTRPLHETDLAVEPAEPGVVRASLLSVEAFEVRRRFGGRGARAARSR